VKASRVLLPLYYFVDHELAITALILYDIDQVSEYVGDSMAVQLRLECSNSTGHLVIGYRIVTHMAWQIKVGNDVFEILEHILLSHVDVLEHGIVTPSATLKAFSWQWSIM
jgi:hypothetical protein